MKRKCEKSSEQNCKNANHKFCKYCNVETQITCLDCDTPFCNDTTDNKSHIVYHMVKSLHKKISISGMDIKCVDCQEENLFRLGCDIGTAAGSEVSLSAVDLSEKMKELTIDSTGELESILKNIYCGKCKDNPKLIEGRKLKIWPSSCSTVDPALVKESVGVIRLRFDPRQHRDTFMYLIDAESKKEKEIKEAMVQSNVTLSVSDGYCLFTIQRTGNDFRVNIGDELEFVAPSGSKFKGHVCEEQFSDQIRVRLRAELQNGIRPGYTVNFIWNPTSYKRMERALMQLYEHRKTNIIYQHIMRGVKETMEDIKVYQPAKLCKLNVTQEIAVKAALTRTLTLIQGPPGTGKTMVSATIVYNLVKHYGKKVLVVAPSNTAADQLAIKINSTGVKVLRVMSRRREDVSSDVDFLCLHRLIKEFPDESRASAQMNLLNIAEVVCCTCVGAGQALLKGQEFPFVLIDEAVQSTEPLSLIPCVYNPKKLILVGDHKQLGPTILDKEIGQRGLQLSLFERLLRIGVQPYMLGVQYRMHPDLCAFPSEYFYEGHLQSGTSMTKVLDIPGNFFYVCDGKEEVNQTRTSFLNKCEAAMVENVIRFLFKNGVLEQQIGVITPYEGQRSYILGQIFGNEPGNLEIKNVDGFQGREKDFIIVSLVRSNVFQGIGFVGDKRRMNVTLTRAKHGLIIIGNPFTLYKSKIWADLLNWYDDKGLLFEGPLNSLKKVTLEQLNLKDDNS